MSVDVSLVGMKVISIDGASVPMICDETAVEGFRGLLHDLESIAGERPDLLIEVETEERGVNQFLVRNPQGLAQYIQERVLNPLVWESPGNLQQAGQELAAGSATTYWFRACW